ncbi:MAG: hypothetical protein QXO54_04460 [Candidatus Methanomethylicaceae archaeon]|nr:hypothetical protein [Candidatus Verstraetearchaeota archaeon]
MTNPPRAPVRIPSGTNIADIPNAKRIADFNFPFDSTRLGI